MYLSGSTCYEGLDLPEVALVGILDADKEGFYEVLLASSRQQDELPDISKDRYTLR